MTAFENVDGHRVPVQPRQETAVPATDHAALTLAAVLNDCDMGYGFAASDDGWVHGVTLNLTRRQAAALARLSDDRAAHDRLWHLIGGSFANEVADADRHLDEWKARDENDVQDEWRAS